MLLIDAKFKRNYKKYIFQCSLAALVTFFILMFVDKISSLIILASYGASTFIAFTMPDSKASKPRGLIGGYIVGSITGVAFFYINSLLSHSLLLESSHISLLLSSALCVGTASFLMVVTDTEHPPAVGMALGLVINEWNYIALSITILAIISLSTVKEFLKPYLINLK